MANDETWFLEDGITWTLMPDELFRMFVKRAAGRDQNRHPARLVYLDTREVERAGEVRGFHGGYTSLISLKDELGIEVNLVISDERRLWKILEERNFVDRKPKDQVKEKDPHRFADLRQAISKAFVHDGKDVVVAPEYDATTVMTNWCRLISAYCLYLLGQREELGQIDFPYRSGLFSFFGRSMNLSIQDLQKVPTPYQSVVAIDLVESLSILMEDARYTDFCGAVMGTVARFSKSFPELNELIIDEANKRKPKAVVDEDLDITAFVRRMLNLNSD